MSDADEDMDSTPEAIDNHSDADEDSTAADNEESDSEDTSVLDDPSVRSEEDTPVLRDEDELTASGSTTSGEVNESVPEEDTSMEYYTAQDNTVMSESSSDYSPGDETLSGSDTSRPETPKTPLTVRRSNRQGRARRIFGYDKLGGNPKMTRYNALMNINTNINKSQPNK